MQWRENHLLLLLLSQMRSLTRSESRPYLFSCLHFLMILYFLISLQESPTKKPRTPAQTVRFKKSADSVTPIRRMTREEVSQVKKWDIIRVLSDLDLIIFIGLWTKWMMTSFREFNSVGINVLTDVLWQSLGAKSAAKKKAAAADNDGEAISDWSPSPPPSRRRMQPEWVSIVLHFISSYLNVQQCRPSQNENNKRWAQCLFPILRLLT